MKYKFYMVIINDMHNNSYDSFHVLENGLLWKIRTRKFLNYAYKNLYRNTVVE